MWIYTGRQTINISTALRIDMERENKGTLTVFSVVALFSSDLKIELAAVEYQHPAHDYELQWDPGEALQYTGGLQAAVTEAEKVIAAIHASLYAGGKFCDIKDVCSRMVTLKGDGEITIL